MTGKAATFISADTKLRVEVPLGRQRGKWAFGSEFGDDVVLRFSEQSFASLPVHCIVSFAETVENFTMCSFCGNVI